MTPKHGSYNTEEEWKLEMVAKMATLATSHDNLAKSVADFVTKNDERQSQLFERSSEINFTVDRLASSVATLAESLDNYSQKTSTEITGINEILHGDGKVNSQNPGIVAMIGKVTGRWTAIVAVITFIATITGEMVCKKFMSMITGHPIP